MCNKVFSQFGVWPIQIHHYFYEIFIGHLSKNLINNFQSVFHNANVTVNLFEFLQMLVGICFEIWNKMFSPQIWYGPIKFIIISRQRSVEACQTIYKQ